MEEWKSIKGYEGLYEVSNLGRVRNTKTLHIKTLWQISNGYYEAHLYKKRHRIHYLVHRLVAIAFIPTNNYSLQVHHKDCNKENNCVNNLEWVTGKENVNKYVEYKQNPYEKGIQDRLEGKVVDNKLPQIY